MPPAPSPNHHTASAQTTESAKAGRSVLLNAIPNPIKNWISANPVLVSTGVIDDRRVPVDRVSHDTRIAGGDAVEHPAEPARALGEEERLYLQHGVSEPNRGKKELEGALEVPLLTDAVPGDPRGRF